MACAPATRLAKCPHRLGLTGIRSYPHIVVVKEKNSLYWAMGKEELKASDGGNFAQNDNGNDAKSNPFIGASFYVNTI